MRERIDKENMNCQANHDFFLFSLLSLSHMVKNDENTQIDLITKSSIDIFDPPPNRKA